MKTVRESGFNKIERGFELADVIVGKMIKIVNLAILGVSFSTAIMYAFMIVSY